MKKYIDAHCHLFDEKLPDNIGAIVNATRPSEWGGVIAQANKNINVWGAIGVHPWFVADLVAGWDEQLQDLLIPKNSVVAIGTVGVLNDPIAKRLFLQGFKEMLKQLEPKEILIYGNRLTELEGYENIRWFEPYMNKFKKKAR